MKLSLNARAALVGLVGAIGALFLFRSGRGSAPNDPDAVVPRDSFLAATIDLAELRRSPVYETVIGREAAKHGSSASLPTRALGMANLAEACGFDPLSRVEKLAVAVPEEEGDRGDFGVAARVQVTREELEKCTKALGSQHAGENRTHDVGPFTVLEDAGGRKLGYASSGLLVVGKGSWFDTMLATGAHEKPSLRDASEHTALRSTLTGREGWAKPTVLVTALLPRSLRDRLKKEMAAEEPSTDASASIMSGVLGVSAAGIAIRAGSAGENLDARLELVCDTAEACTSVQKLIQRKRLDWSKDLTLRMVGFGALIDSLDVRVDGTAVHASLSTSANALAAAIDRALRFRSHRAEEPAPPPPSRDATPASSRDGERILARDAGRGD